MDSKKRLGLFGLLSIALVLGCSADDPAAAAETDVEHVTITSDAFTPASLHVKVGETVRWTWEGGEHNVVSGSDCDKPDDNFRSGAPVQGGTFDKKFEVAGTFPYYCENHCTMGMKGEIVVE
jgi:plastocyanin